MRIISVEAVQGGEILAEPVMNEQNNILIPEGTAIKEDYVPLIMSFGIEKIAIKDPYEDYEKPNYILDSEFMDSCVKRVKNLMEKHIYHGGTSLREFEIIANEIVREINSKKEDSIIDITERTADLYEHTVMVTMICVALAKKLHMDKNKQFNIAIGCLLHDIGIRYITVPYENCEVEKGDMASVFEYKKHTIMGYSAVEEEAWVPAISKKMILSHHERLDGSGFPMRQKAKEMELRLIQACDAFDCMISGVECLRISIQDALEYMATNKDSLFDGKIVDALLSLVAKYPVGTNVCMDDDRQGVVVEQTADPKNPIIMIIDAKGAISEETEYNLSIEKDISILHVV